MKAAEGLALYFSRCNAPGRIEEWSRWLREIHVPAPVADLTGHIMAYVMSNDPGRVVEWDRWNDDVHMAEMLESGAFTGVSRWRRRSRGTRGPHHLTLYDVGPCGVDEAVMRSATVMPGLTAAGRKLDCHVGGLTLTVERG